MTNINFKTDTSRGSLGMMSEAIATAEKYAKISGIKPIMPRVGNSCTPSILKILSDMPADAAKQILHAAAERVINQKIKN